MVGVRLVHSAQAFKNTPHGPGVLTLNHFVPPDFLLSSLDQILDFLFRLDKSFSSALLFSDVVAPINSLLDVLIDEGDWLFPQFLLADVLVGCAEDDVPQCFFVFGGVPWWAEVRIRCSMSLV